MQYTILYIPWLQLHIYIGYVGTWLSCRKRGHCFGTKVVNLKITHSGNLQKCERTNVQMHGGVAKANISLAFALHSSQLHNCCLYFGLSACEMRHSNANAQRN